MRTLQERYRAALRWYPAPWRKANGHAAIGTLLDKAEAEGRTKPRAAELVDLAAHGLAERARMAPAAVPAAIRDRASTAALGVGTAIAVTAAIQLEVPPREYSVYFGHEPATFGPFASPMIIVYAAWIAGFLTSIAGNARATRWIVSATIPLTVTARIVSDATGMELRPTWTFLGLLIALGILVIAGSPASGRAGIRWLIVWFLPAFLAFSASQLAGGTFAYQEPAWLRTPGMLSWSPIIAISAVVLLQLARQRSWSAAVSLVAAPFVLAAVFSGRGVSMEMAGIAVAIALAVTAGMVLLRAFGFRVRIQRMPRS